MLKNCEFPNDLLRKKEIKKMIRVVFCFGQAQIFNASYVNTKYIIMFDFQTESMMVCIHFIDAKFYEN
jgi:hypothetical protein